MIFGKEEGVLRSKIGGRTVRDWVCWVWWLLLSPSPLHWWNSQEGVRDNWIPFGGPVFRQIRRFRESFSLFLVFSGDYSSKWSVCQSSRLWSGRSWPLLVIFGAPYSTALHHLLRWWRRLRGVGGWRRGNSYQKLSTLVCIPLEIPKKCCWVCELKVQRNLSWRYFLEHINVSVILKAMRQADLTKKGNVVFELEDMDPDSSSMFGDL